MRSIRENGLLLECELCKKLDNGMSLYSINTLPKNKPYADKYMRAHVLKYHLESLSKNV